MTLRRKELAEVLNEKALYPASKCAEYVDMIFEIMAETIERGENIKIQGFGVFRVREKRARKGRNPKTGERMEISARWIVTFKVSGSLRKALNRGSV
jgi:integration host factor subunit alpha